MEVEETPPWYSLSVDQSSDESALQGTGKKNASKEESELWRWAPFLRNSSLKGDASLLKRLLSAADKSFTRAFISQTKREEQSKECKIFPPLFVPASILLPFNLPCTEMVVDPFTFSIY